MKLVLQVLKLTNANVLLAITLLICNGYAARFGQVNLTIATKEEVHNYVVLGSIEARLGRFYLHSNKNLCKFGCHDWLPWKHSNHDNSK